MTPEFITALAAIIAIAISFRTASHTELRSLFDTLRLDFDRYKKESQEREDKYEKQIDDMEKEITALTRQNENFKRYIARLINQLEKAGILPEKMED